VSKDGIILGSDGGKTLLLREILERDYAGVQPYVVSHVVLNPDDMSGSVTAEELSLITQKLDGGQKKTKQQRAATKARRKQR